MKQHLPRSPPLLAKHFDMMMNHIHDVIPGRDPFASDPGIHNHRREYGFRACAKRRIPE